MPYFSIVMPCHNAERYLWDALATVVAQSFQDWELIAVNDGSTDGTEAILQEAYSADRRVRVIQQNNQGPGAARNAGLSAATGKVLERIERQLNH
jgi:glycosyltransferase involved in cell wall biosynthesis